MAAATLGRVILAAPRQLELKSVFGEGREGRWETVQKIFREQIEPLYGSQGELLKELPTSETLKTRLLVVGKDPVGVLVYRTVADDPFKKQLGRCLELKMLYADEKRQDALDFLLKHVMELAKEHHADALCIKTKKQAPLISFFDQNKFQNIEEQEGDILYSRKVEDLTNGSHKADEVKPGKREKISPPPASHKTSSVSSRSPTFQESGKRKEQDESELVRSPKRYRAEERAERPSWEAVKSPTVAQLRDQYESRAQPQPRLEPRLPAPRFIEGVPVVQSSKKLLEKRERLELARKKSDQCPLKIQYLRLILTGEKTIEGRINTGPFLRYNAGTFVRFFSGNTEAYCEVKKVVRYPSFADMLRTEGVKPCLGPHVTLDEGIRIYDGIPGYAQKAQRFGVLAIHIEHLQ